MIKISTSAITKMPYADFVSFIGLDNTPPGGLQTIKLWIERSNLDSRSRVLDLACNNGFSSRNISLLTGAHSYGIDLSAVSIKLARSLSAKDAGLSKLVKYKTGNATDLDFKNDSFSHVVAGCCFGFISNKETALNEVHRVLQKDGALCVANFFYHTPPPAKLVSLVEQTTQIQKDRPRSDQDWKLFFEKKLTRYANKVHKLEVLDQPALVDYCTNLLAQRSSTYNRLSADRQQACLTRLVSIRGLLNEHRKYQSFNISVYRK